jgi:hypothetical protein
VHVITVGVRATVPSKNVEVLKSLGVIEKPAQKKVQSTLAQHVAAAHLNKSCPNIEDSPQNKAIIITNMLNNKCIKPKTGVG